MRLPPVLLTFGSYSEQGSSRSSCRPLTRATPSFRTPSDDEPTGIAGGIAVYFEEGAMRLVALPQVVTALAVGAGAAFLACESSHKPPPPVASVAVTPAAAGLTALDDTTRLSAHAKDADGNELTGRTFTWASSDQAIATVGATGLVTAVANGVATLTATSEGVDGHATVTVAQAVATITVTPPTASLGALGATARLAGAAFDANGHPIVGQAFGWASSNAAVATVDTSGTVTALAGGSATITASAGGKSAGADVTVAQVAKSVTVTPGTRSFGALGDTVRLAAEAKDANGHAIPSKTFTWATSDAGVATVGASGLVTAVANGTATISAAADGVADTAEVTVAQVLASVAVTPSAPGLGTLGGTVQLAASALDANGHAIAGKTFDWTTSDAGIATVVASGLVTAVANGAATVTATTESVAGTASVTVAQKAATLALSPAGATVSGVGATHQFTVEAHDSGGSLIPAPFVHATWMSLNANVATVVPLTGVAAAVGAGQVTVKAEMDGAVDYGVLTVVTPGLAPVNLWAQLDYPFTEMVEDLWGTSAANVFAAAGPSVLHYDGTSWTRMTQGPFNNMDVWGTSASDVYAVGDAGRVLHYDGTVWSQMSIGLSGLLASVWGASPRDIFAVSWDGTVVRFDGAHWASEGKPSSHEFYEVWGASAHDVFAVGRNDAYHYDGTSWSQASTGLTDGIASVWGTSGTDVYGAFGGNVFHYDGTSWTRLTWFAPIWIDAIWGSSGTDIYFAGRDLEDRAAVLHYDGTLWKMTRSPIPFALKGLWGAPTGELFAVGTDGYNRSTKVTIVRGYRGGSVAVTPSSATITGSGNQLQLATSAAAAGSPVTGVTFLWSSSDTAVATVDGDGLVTGLTNGTATITGTAFGGASASMTVTVALTQSPPVARIDEPAGDTLLTRGESIEFKGTATDADGTIASHHWDFGDGTTASVEDPGGHTYPNLGVYRVTYRVTDDDGATSPVATASITVAYNQHPKVGITSPENGAVFAPGTAITFTGLATDHEDGVLTGAALVWTSDRDGQIGTGNTFTRSDLSEGTHLITLTASDTYVWSANAQVTITVRSHTPLYLASVGSTGFLSGTPAISGYVTRWLYNYGEGQSTEFPAVLGDSIVGTSYGFSLWLGAGTSPGQTGTWTADILVAHGGARTTLATRVFTVPNATVFAEYTASVTGVTAGAPGDTIVLRLTLGDVSQGAVRYGAPPVDSRILVPGVLTVSQPTAPLRAPLAETEGVRVEVSTTPSLRYPTP